MDYTNYTSDAGEGVVQFDRFYGLLSTPLSISLLSDNIAEGAEVFGLNFVQIISDDDNPILITPVDPVQAIVAINDTNGEWTITWCRCDLFIMTYIRVFCSVSIKCPINIYPYW